MKVYLATFGCRANQYDTERVRGMLLRGGQEIVATPAEADMAVFNSCAVTADAEADLRQQVRRAARANRALRSVVMGCAAALDRGAIRALPTVERVVAGADSFEVAAALGLPVAAIPSGALEQSGSRALLRIQDGCDEHCTFCATTRARGASRSRPPEEVTEEACGLAERHAEIVLTGIHIGTYGHDIGCSLSGLVERLVRCVPRVRFRLSSVEATEVDARLIELLTSDSSRVAPHLHAPLQSGSDGVLKRMGRHWYTAAGYADAVRSIVGRTDVFGLGADVIAGFPGETEADHRASLNAVDSLPFTYLHVFPFSPRPGTAAERLPGRVSSDLIAYRARELRAAGAEKAARYRSRRVGEAVDVVVVGAGANREGLTEDYLTVRLSDPTIPRGARVRSRLEMSDGSLCARPIAL